MQLSASTEAFFLAILMELLGHSSTHVSHPVHLLISTFAGIKPTLSKERQNLLLIFV
jgi:hypothetical protein